MAYQPGLRFASCAASSLNAFRSTCSGCAGENKQKYYVSLNLFSNKYIEEKHYESTAVGFELYRLGGSQRMIAERCLAGEYKIGESELIYNKKKRCWFLNLTYGNTAQKTKVEKSGIIEI